MPINAPSHRAARLSWTRRPSTAARQMHSELASTNGWWRIVESVASKSPGPKTARPSSNDPHRTCVNSSPRCVCGGRQDPAAMRSRNKLVFRSWGSLTRLQRIPGPSRRQRDISQCRMLRGQSMPSGSAGLRLITGATTGAGDVSSLANVAARASGESTMPCSSSMSCAPIFSKPRIAARQVEQRST